MTLLAHRTVLISGVGPGLGFEVARACLAQGASVVLGDMVEDRVRSLADTLDPSGDRVLPVRMDITSKEDCAIAHDAAVERFGGLDGLVNVAAVDMSSVGLEHGDLDDWERTAGVNVKGTMQLTKAVLPSLKKTGGSVVMISSNIIAKDRPTGLMLSYAMSKGALEVGAKFLARELGPAGIRVNVVAPGWKWGPALEQHLEQRAAASGTTLTALVEEIAADLALRRLSSDEDVAGAVVLFLSDLARALTGQIVFADSGDAF